MNAKSLNGILMKAGTNLFCLPFAGGNKYSYQKYMDKAPAFLNIIPLEYPGRGARIKEALISDAELLVNESGLEVDFRQVPGKHFFIFNCPRVIVDIISKKLSVYTKAYQL